MSKYDFGINMNTNNSHSIILHRISEHSKVLEFGPATGSMTRYMKEELGCEIFCVEIDKNAAEKAKIYCDKMIISNLDTLEWVKDLEGHKFDHIIYADVLEHLYNPWEVLKVSLDFLKENGTVISSIPNVSHSAIIMELLEGKFNYNQIGLLDDTHIRFFTKNSVLDLLEQSGLFPVEWLATFALPEQTEFKQKYSNLPESVERYLKQKENAHVYQFVTVSKRKQDVSIEEYSNQLTNKPDYLFNEYLQVFWEVNGLYKEEHSLKIPLINSNDYITYDIVIPEGAGSKLRLDPINKMAYVDINKIIIFDDDPHAIKDPTSQMIWSEENCFSGLVEQNGILRLKSSSYCFFCTTNDPQLSLDGILLSDNNKKRYLRIMMRVLEDIPEIIVKANQHIEYIKNELIETNRKFKIETDNSYENKQKLDEKEKFINRLVEVSEFLQNDLKEKDKILNITAELLMKKDEQLNNTIMILNKKDELLNNTIENLKNKDEQLKNTLDVLQKKEEIVSSLNGLITDLSEKSNSLQKTLNDLMNSTSWKITKGLRKIGHFFKK
ncbi:class I SAM-dependent methyltransferase [Paenibacillus piri]|uniref:Methyltransferase domain-containing protein n=1 Tax=Paenibacillus piri TaxID=2547395 RepID=A0A4R5KMP6_9BACL|nr:class I SAM-dependent methyltransferase [Paenibacillus piri]TDF96205.1 methyltransferase domain-containing protein [Paenibacillus piri]